MTRRLLLLPPALWLALAHVAPLLVLVRIGLADVYPGPPGAEPGWSLAAIRAFVEGPGYPAALGRSVGLAVAATVVSLLVALPLALHVALRVPPGRRWRRLLWLVAPFWAGEVVRMIALVLSLSHRGPVNTLLRAVGLEGGGLLYGPGPVLLGTVYTVLLTVLLPVYAALDRLPPGVLDAAADLGAGPWRRTWSVAVPLAAHGIAAGCALGFLSSLGLLAAPSLLGGAGHPVFATVIAGLFGGATGRWPMGAAFGLILLAAGLVGAGSIAWPTRRRSA